MPVLQRAFCCVQVKYGTIFIGWMGCISVTLQLLLLLSRAATGHVYFPILLPIIPIACLMYALYIGLIRAGYTQNRHQLFPWLVIYPIMVILFNILNLYLLFHLLGEWPAFIIGMLIGDLFIVYLWLIVFSYYQELKEQENLSRLQNATDV